MVTDPTDTNKLSSGEAMSAEPLTPDEIEARREVIADTSIVDPEPPEIDPNKVLHFNLSTLAEDETDLAVVIDRLNDLLLAFSMICDDAKGNRETLAMVAQKTSAMKGPHTSKSRVQPEVVLKLGEHVDEKGAVVWLQDRLSGWAPGQRYFNASKITDELNAAGFTDRRGQRYDQRAMQQLARMGCKPYQGRWD